MNKNYPLPLILILALFILDACSSDEKIEIPITRISKSIAIDLNDTRQNIVGFGGCNSVFRGASNYPNEGDMQKAYGTGENELGLSMFRVSIPSVSSRWYG